MNNHKNWTVKDKNILISGSSNGIGFYTALGLAKQGAHVIIVSHNQENSEQAVTKIREKVKQASVVYYVADLSSHREIRQLSNKLKQEYDHLDVLINNAGGWFSSFQESEDGIEKTFALNHLNYFMITGLLLDLLKESKAARIINVASDAHKGVEEINFEDIGFEHNYRPFKVYAQSKLANIMFTYKLAERLKGTGITVNALHPGAVASKLYRNFGILEPLILFWIKFFGKNSREGAETSLYLANSEEVSGVTGKYFVDKNQVKSSKASYQQEEWQRLWKLSEELTGVDYPI